MKKSNLLKKLHATMKHRPIGLFALATVVLSSIVITTQAEALYILTGADDSAIVLNGTQKSPGLSNQMVHVSSSSQGYDVQLNSGLDVIIRHNGKMMTTKSKNETVSALLKRMNITPSPLEMIAVDRSANRLDLSIAEEVTYYEEIHEPASFNTVRVANPKLPKGTEKVTQEGKDGVRTSIYEVVWSSGKQISRQFVEELDSTAVDRVVEYGTAVASAGKQERISSVKKNADGSGTLILASGATLKYSQAKTMTATAYTAGHGGVGTITATGTVVDVGTVAVDKNVIPLGTRMYIVTNDGIVYGMATARDTGVRGNKVDLYYNSYRECIEFGRRSCTVYILE